MIRRGTANPRIQIDNSGIFAYAPGVSTTPKFSVDAATGIMTATSGVFSGSVTASTLTGNTISGGTITAGVMTAMSVSSGTITGGTIRTSASNPRIQMGTAVLNATDSGGNVKFSVSASTGLLTASDASISGSITASSISGGTISGSYISGGTIAGTATFSTDGYYMNVGTASNYSQSGHIYFRNASANRSYISSYRASSGADTMILSAYSGSDWGTVSVDGIFNPLKRIKLTEGFETDVYPHSTWSGSVDLGQVSSGWRYIYLYDFYTGGVRRVNLYNGAFNVV